MDKHILISKREKTPEGWTIHVTQNYHPQMDGGHIKFYIRDKKHILCAESSSGGAPIGKLDRDGCEHFHDVRFVLRDLRQRKVKGGDE